MSPTSYLTAPPRINKGAEYREGSWKVQVGMAKGQSQYVAGHGAGSMGKSDPA